MRGPPSNTPEVIKAVNGAPRSVQLGALANILARQLRDHRKGELHHGTVKEDRVRVAHPAVGGRPRPFNANTCTVVGAPPSQGSTLLR